MARRAALIECQDLFTGCCRIYKGRTIPDLAMWMALTKKRIFNPVKFFHWSLTHRWFWAGSMVLAWCHGWRQILFGRRYKLWSPHPCLATHMVPGLEAPGVDWPKEFQKHLAGIRRKSRSPDRRHHRTGWFVSGENAACQRLQSAWHHPLPGGTLTLASTSATCRDELPSTV